MKEMNFKIVTENKIEIVTKKVNYLASNIISNNNINSIDKKVNHLLINTLYGNIEIYCEDIDVLFESFKSIITGLKY